MSIFLITIDFVVICGTPRAVVVTISEEVGFGLKMWWPSKTLVSLFALRENRAIKSLNSCTLFAV